MKEDFLHYIWKFQRFSNPLVTTKGECVEVASVGMQNQLSGPDFLNAKLTIGNQLWIGNIEIHIRASDWFLHKHETDTNYDAVILHVVWEEDVEVYGRDNNPLPTVELSKIISEELLIQYQRFEFSENSWIPCEKIVDLPKPVLLSNWLERLFVQRLENKSLLIEQLLKKSNNDWEAVLFQLLAKGFGLNNNGDAFLHWAQSFPFSILRKLWHDSQDVAALFFGQAGMLEDDIEEGFYQSLKAKYTYIKHKYQLNLGSKNQFQFYGLRPHNFPTIRLAQLTALYSAHKTIFSMLTGSISLKEVYDVFDVEVDSFWNEHYTFSKASKKRTKRLTQNFVDLLLINVIIPIKFTLYKAKNEDKNDELFQLITGVSPEKNTIVNKFKEIGLKSKNALETQALIELKNNYCAKKRCLQCAIGHKVLNN